MGETVKKTIVSLAVAAVWLWGPSPARAQSCDLSATPSNLSTQLSAAQSGQTLCLASGNYASTNGKAGVTIAAAPGAAVNIAGSHPVSGAKFVGINWTAPVCINATNVLIDRSTFNNLGQGCNEGRLSLQGNGSGTVISNSVFSGGTSDGIQLTGGATGYHIGPGNIFQNILQGGCGTVHCDPIQFYGGSNNVIDGNLFWNNSTGIMSPDCNGSPMTVTNNVWDQEQGSAANVIMIGGGNGDIIDHNTFTTKNNSAPRFGNPNGCGLSKNETVTNNIIPAGILLTDGTSSSSITQDYNLCKSSCAGPHSLTGQASYVGGTTPSSYAGFALTSSSIGRGAGSNGTDMGINISGASSSAPAPPTNLQVTVQ